MATGYTAKLYDNKETNFEEFALECARAFGALIEFRDTPDAEIPEEFTVDNGYYEDIEQAKARCKFWEEMPQEEQLRLATIDHEESIARQYEAALLNNELRERYSEMLDKARNWTPPTKEHEGLQEFMIDQLEDSIRHDCRTVFNLAELLQELKDKPINVDQYYSQNVSAANSWLTYTIGKLEDETKKLKGRSAWISDLRQSLREEF